MRTIGQISGSQDELYRKLGENIKSTTRVAEPGIVQSFDPVEQTVTVQLTIREQITNEDGKKQWVNLPLLLDVPIFMPRGGGFVLTMPVTKGDECLVIFGDMCMDAWFSNGGIQNQIEKRRHDLSDGYAILGIWSQPNVIPNYSTTTAQLRNLSGTQYIELGKNEINIVGNVKVNGEAI
ncbi:Gp138 family membrane-puncturing spike protein [Clostridium estertheticum]|uniref:Gp138 family membrane-puncturing spike protein n=1 Tax=Clostridium estertheticum TaxID=238834 RepID=UPI001C7DB396|nr:Gp138 family membrane-puncturing spike protein [Clostridium estertheticum]MBX4266532.1 hypothetical protein [Clostridium estertheticum]WLC88128.1 hypothetical protein KTC95_19235 [Clostridium estertheticum]